MAGPAHAAGRNSNGNGNGNGGSLMRSSVASSSTTAASSASSSFLSRLSAASASDGNGAAVDEETMARAVDRFFTLLEERLASACTDAAQPQPPQPFPTLLFEVGGLPCAFRIGQGGAAPGGEGEEGDLAMPPRVTRVPIEDRGQQDDDVQCRITCDLPTLLQLATGRLAPAAALLTGRVRLKGDKSALRVLGAPMAGAGKQLAEEFRGLFAGVLRKGGKGKGGAAGGAEAPLLLLSEELSLGLFVERRLWEDDAAREACALCSRAFTLSRRRHHCRMCGKLHCHACCDERVLGKRTCAGCLDLVLSSYVGAHMHVAAATTTTTTGDGSSSGEPQANGSPPDAAATARQSRAGSMRSSSGGGGRSSSLAINGERSSSSSGAAASSAGGTGQQQQPPLAPGGGEGALMELLQARLDTFQALEISCREPEPNDDALPTNAAAEKQPAPTPSPPPPPPPAAAATASIAAILETLAAHALVVAAAVLLCRPHGRWALAGSFIGTPLLLTLLLSPTYLPAALLGAYYTHLPSLPLLLPPHLPSITHGLDTRLLALADAGVHNPLWPLLVGAILVKGYFPLRWWLFRGLYIYGTAAVVIGLYVSLHYYAKLRGWEDTLRARELYESWDAWAGPWVCRRFVSLRSVFVKFGQYVGGRSDMVPPAWAAALSLLQDQLPPCPPAYVHRLVGAEFRKPFALLFSAFDASPLASASVAQVHRACLAPGAVPGYLRRQQQRDGGDGGRDVVVKVQHQGIAALMASDMVAAARCLHVVAWLNADFALLLHLLEAWAEEIERELDFRVEASNLERVRENLVARAGIDVIVPRPLEGLVARRAFAMEFVQGFKITDLQQLDRFHVDRTALMTRVCQAYFTQFFLDGFFNADPHAGNIMVNVSQSSPTAPLRCRPVLLDFGMTVELPLRRRLAYCRLIFAVNRLDARAAVAALKEVGYATSQSEEHPERDVQWFQFLLRDTGARAAQRADAEKFMAMRKAQREADKRAKGAATSRHMTELPAGIFFLFRMVGLIRGLCTTLEVELPYLDMMAAYAQKALVLAHPRQHRAPSFLRLSARPPLPLEARLQSLLLALCRSGRALGLQVAVVREGRLLLDVAAGVCGAADPRPVHRDTLFPILDLGNVLTALLLHVFCREGALRYDAPLAALLPSLLPPDSPAGHATLRSLLSHSSGLHLAIPPSLPAATLTDPAKCRPLLAAAAPAYAPNAGRADHSLVAFGHWALALLGEKCNVPPPQLSRAFQDRILRPLKLTGQVHMGGPGLSPSLSSSSQEETPNSQGQGQGRSIALLHHGFSRQLKPLLAEMRLAAAAGGSVAPTLTPSSGHGGGLKEEEEGNGGGSSGASLPSVGGGSTDGGMGALAERALLQPGMVNDPAVREGLCPGVNALATARALATVLEAVGGGTRLLSRQQQAMLRRAEATEVCPLHGRRRWGLGLQVSEEGVLGHEAFGGSAALLFPRAHTAIAVTTNDLSLDRAATREVLRFLAHELGLSLPAFVDPDQPRGAMF